MRHSYNLEEQRQDLATVSSQLHCGRPPQLQEGQWEFQQVLAGDFIPTGAHDFAVEGELQGSAFC